MTKSRLLRDSDDLSDDTTIVVRGGLLDAMALRADALRNAEIYGTFGISVFALKGATVDELASTRPLVRFARLTLMTAGEIRSHGLRLEPTGQNPRHYDIAFDDLDQGIDELLNCEHSIVDNRYHEPD